MRIRGWPSSWRRTRERSWGRGCGSSTCWTGTGPGSTAWGSSGWRPTRSTDRRRMGRTSPSAHHPRWTSHCVGPRSPGVRLLASARLRAEIRRPGDCVGARQRATVSLAHRHRPRGADPRVGISLPRFPCYFPRGSCNGIAVVVRTREAAVQQAATIVLGLDPPELAEEVMDFLDRTGRARVVGTATNGPELGKAVRERQPNAVVAQPDLMEAAGPLDGSAFLALATSESVAVLRQSLRAGASGFFLWPDERAELARAASMSAPPPDRPDGSRALMVAVYGPRGGAGTTFVATHLAASFARDGKDAVLVDLDPVFGDVTAALGVPSDPAPKTVADLVPVADEVG